MKTCHSLDTSVLIKRYHREVGTDRVNALFESEEAVLFISDLAIIEFYSALARKVRTGELTQEGYGQVCDFFLGECDQGVFRIEGVNDIVKGRSMELLNRYALESSLRTLDSLQLATAIVLKEREGLDYFVTADSRLAQIVEWAGIGVINPESP